MRIIKEMSLKKISEKDDVDDEMNEDSDNDEMLITRSIGQMEDSSSEDTSEE